jgi:hypothetical protein
VWSSHGRTLEHRCSLAPGTNRRDH